MDNQNQTDQNKAEPLKLLKTQVTDYVELRSEHTRLSVIETSAKVTAYFTSTLIALILVMFLVLSLFISMSFFFGQMLHNYSLGFLISAGIYLLLLFVFFALWRKKLEKSIINKIIEITND